MSLVRPSTPLHPAYQTGRFANAFIILYCSFVHKAFALVNVLILRALYLTSLCNVFPLNVCHLLKAFHSLAVYLSQRLSAVNALISLASIILVLSYTLILFLLFKHVVSA